MKHGVWIVVWLCAGWCRAQHLGAYSQHMFNGLLLNPAYAGSTEALQLSTMYRRQWLGLDGAPTTLNLSAHLPFKRRKAAAGLVLTNDRFGVSETTSALAVYAYRFRLGRGRLSLGLQGGIHLQQNNWNHIKTTQDRDPSFAGQAQRNIHPQAGVGLYYHTARFFTGASAPELLNSSNQKFKTLTLTAGGLLNANQPLRFKPVLLLRYLRHSPFDANLSCIVYWKDVVGLGGGGGLSRTAFAYFDLRITEQFRLGYAYDYTFNRLRNYNSGSHELMLRYLMEYTVQAPSLRYF